MNRRYSRRPRSLAIEHLERRDMLATDVASLVGLASEYYYSDSAHSLGVVWIDVNNDSYPDIFATNGFDNPAYNYGLRPHLYLNRGDGTFELRDDLLPEFARIEHVGAKAADYDRDGDMDLYVYTAHETFAMEPHLNPEDGPANLLLKNQFVERGGVLAGPLFVDVAAEAGVLDCPQVPLVGVYGCYQSRSAAWLDYDLDGWQDLYVGHMVMNRAGSISDPIADARGKLISTDVFYRNNGDGTFSETTTVINAGNATKRGALVTVAGHLNGDMYPDIYVGNAGMWNDLPSEDYHDAILINDGNGRLNAVLVNHGDDTPAAMGIDFADLNDDGRYDIYITDWYDHPEDHGDPNKVGNTLYLSTASGLTDNLAAARSLAAETSWGTNFFDVNLDGLEDLFVGLDNGAKSVIFINQGGSTFRSFIPSGRVRGSAIADYDRDGDPDLLFVNQGGRLQLYRNESQAPGRFVVELVPAHGVGAIGAIVELTTTDGKRQTRQIKGGTSAHSQDYTREVYFGLGSSTVRSISVRWPNSAGLRQSILAPLGTRLTVYETPPLRHNPSGSELAALAERLAVVGSGFKDSSPSVDKAAAAPLRVEAPFADSYLRDAVYSQPQSDPDDRIQPLEESAAWEKAVDQALDDLLTDLLTIAD